MFYLGLELSALPIGALVAFETSKRVSAEAGIKFALSAAMASGTAVFGISLIYATTGSIYFEDLANLLAYSNLSLLGFVFFFAGLAASSSSNDTSSSSTISSSIQGSSEADGCLVVDDDAMVWIRSVERKKSCFWDFIRY